MADISTPHDSSEIPETPVARDAAPRQRAGRTHPPASAAAPRSPAPRSAPSRPAPSRSAAARAESAEQAEPPTDDQDATEADEAEPRESIFGSAGFRRWIRQSSAMLVSTIVHMVAFLALSLMVIQPEVVRNVQEVIVTALEPPEVEDELKVELENQIVDITEPTNALMSSSMEVGAVGASGPAGSISAPALDQQATDQLEVSAVKVEGIEIDIPNDKLMIAEVPDGQIGDARAIVDNYEEALDRITQEIMWMLDKSKVLVVWHFDQSESMKDDQKEIRGRIDHVYRQLGLLSRSNDGSLETAVTSYGESFLVHTRRPSHDMDEIRQAIDSVPIDPSGKEMMCSSIQQAIAIHRPYANRTNRQMAMVIVTDESGDSADNNAMLERAIAEAKAAKCKIYVLGREAVFGYPYAHIRWIHPQTKHHHWIAIDRGPETAFVEQLQTDGFHRRYDAHSSGFGPYECTRLGRETGGIFFMLPTVEKDLVRGHKDRYALEAMRPYLPDLRSRMEVSVERDESPLRTALTKVIYDLNPYQPEIAKIIVMRVHFSPDLGQLVEQARTEQRKAIIYLDYLAKVQEEVEKLEDLRRQEPSPRWQANYDLLYAQVIAYQARMYEYGAYLEEFIKNPRVVPSTKGKDLTHVRWDITTRKRILTGKVVEPYIARATELFKDVITNHAGTPWAARAQHELNRGFGVELVEVYDAPNPYIPPGTPLLPVPKL